MSQARLPFRRLLVALDASPGSLSALAVAADLAARIRAEIEGLFVEDEDLIRLARHPEAWHVSLPSGDAHPMPDAALEAQLGAVAERAHAALRAALARTHISGTFRVVRGCVVDEVVGAADGADLLVLGSTGRPFATHLGPIARAAAAGSAGPVLLLPRGATLAGPVQVLFDEAPDAEAALETAAWLAHAAASEVVVQTIGTTGATERADRAVGWLLQQSIRARSLVLAPDDATGLRNALRRERRGIVVVGAASPLVQGDRLGVFLAQIGRPVWLVR